jgi:mannose-6-phosphate isomerase-like protein (cupin superfamily)
MRKIAILGFMFLFLFSGQAMAQPVAKHLIDSKPGEAVLISLGEWFPANPLKEGKVKTNRVYESSRGTINLLVIKDTKIGLHLHTTVDEIVYVYKGSGEMYINGKWVPVKAGDLHVCPRGVAHSTRAGNEELWAISIFTPPMPEAGDRVTIE